MADRWRAGALDMEEALRHMPAAGARHDAAGLTVHTIRRRPGEAPRAQDAPKRMAS
jgi:hypothetical protein